MTEFASALHDCAEHLVIASACEEDFTSIKLKERAADRPHINTKVIRHAENCQWFQQCLGSTVGAICVLTDFWSTIKATNEILSNLVLRRV